MADPIPPIASPGIQITEYGIYCKPDTERTEDAPETSLAYIQVFTGQPEFRYRQQDVPARLGVSFGVVVVSDVTIPEVRIETWKPGADKPEVWYTEFAAGGESMRGFSFDFEEELLTGMWRMEAWDGDTRLYSVEFDVLPPSSLPGVGSGCAFLS